MASRFAITGKRRAPAVARIILAAVTALILTQAWLAETGHAATGDLDSADRLIFWLDCREDMAEMTDAELDAWKSRGVDGFVCGIPHLRGMGGTQDFTGDASADLSGSNYELQRALRDSKLVERAAAREMKMYLGVYLVNYWNPATPLNDWFDDAAWSGVALPKISDLAGAARLLGFSGLAFDQELYPQANGVSTATWAWDYPGNTHSEAEVRAQAKERGRQVMQTMLDAFPGAELMAYDAQLPESWMELVQEKVNGNENAFADRLDIDFLEGLLSAKGYAAVRLVDATFYKLPHLGSWNTAFTYAYNRMSSLLSRRLSNWEYASSRLFISPFSWIDEGPCGCGFDDPQPPAYVAEQLLAFRKWGMGGEFANFAFAGLDGFDYAPYLSAMTTASSPAKVDLEVPTLELVSGAKTRKSTALIKGTAHDNLAVWAVRWEDDRGGSGVARLDWKVKSGGYESGYVWTTEWSFPADEITPGSRTVSITAEDIKGHASKPTLVRLADSRAPRTKISAKPQPRTRDPIARFGFEADEPRPAFACKIDQEPWSACNRGRAVYRLRAGRHLFMVRATDRAGNTDPTPARFRFSIERH